MSGGGAEVNPTAFLKHGASQNIERTALVVLNQPIPDVEVLSRLWASAGIRLCADGGANQLYDLLKRHDPSLLDSYLPDFVHGDLDSLRNDVRDYYEKQGVAVTQDPDQYSTDFGKAIKQLLQSKSTLRDVVVLGTIAGRLDQGIGLLGEFYREQVSSEHSGLLLWLFSESSITFIIRPGRATIQTPLGEGMITPNVGILPVYGPANITTHGLEWDVENWHTNMGGQVSTSNHIINDTVVIESDFEVLFTVERNVGVAG